MPYPNQATPDVGAARGRVRQLVGDLVPNAVDEGTGAALDPLIASWTSGWLSRTDSQHADHQAVIDRLVGGARRAAGRGRGGPERDRRALEIARRDYAQAREALLEPAEPAPTPSAPDAGERPRARSPRHGAPGPGGATLPTAPTGRTDSGAPSPGRGEGRADEGQADQGPADPGPLDQGPPGAGHRPDAGAAADRCGAHPVSRRDAAPTLPPPPNT